jgi:hypothetical protein
MFSDISVVFSKAFYVKIYKFNNVILKKLQIYNLLQTQFGSELLWLEEASFFKSGLVIHKAAWRETD